MFQLPDLRRPSRVEIYVLTDCCDNASAGLQACSVSYSPMIIDFGKSNLYVRFCIVLVHESFGELRARHEK